jgi:hypothetical protein
MLNGMQVEQRKLNSESTEINDILNLCEVGATDCDDLRMFQDSLRLRRNFENADEM